MHLLSLSAICSSLVRYMSAFIPNIYRTSNVQVPDMNRRYCLVICLFHWGSIIDILEIFTWYVVGQTATEIIYYNVDATKRWDGNWGIVWQSISKYQLRGRRTAWKWWWWITVLWSAEDGWCDNNERIKALYEVWIKRINWYCTGMRKAGWVHINHALSKTVCCYHKTQQ